MDPIVLSGILGFIVPPVVSFVKHVGWPKWARVAAAVVVSGAFAVISLIQDGKLTDASWKTILANVGVAFAVSQVFYHTYFQDTAANEKLEKIQVL